MNGNGYYSGREISPRLMQIAIALLIGVVVMGVMAIKGCQRGPFGRRQIVQMSGEEQIALGAQAFRETLRTATVVPDGPVVRGVKEVTSRLVRATSNPEFLRLTKLTERRYEWDVRVVESREMNAFCLPGGKMVVYTGILPVCQTDAGLATVIGHEISHALGQHGAERMAQARLAQIGMVTVGAGMGNMDPGERNRVMMILNAGAQFGILSYGRGHESEADHMGLLLMAAAGFDPRASVSFWERMKARAGSGRTPEFLSTHPSHETRIRDLTNWIPEAMPLYEASPDRGPPHKLPLR